MGLNHLEMHFTDKAAPFIAEAGGKMGGLNYLKANVPALKDFILPIQVVRPGEKLSDIKVPAGDEGKYIVRGSDPCDFQGLVDVLATEEGEKDDLVWLVRKVQEQAQSLAVRAYGKYENPSFDGKVFVGIQPYLNCQRGSIVEHPNIPGNYVISFVGQNYDAGLDTPFTCMYNLKEDDFEHFSGSSNDVEGEVEERVKQAVELYQKVDSSGLAKPGYSFQAELLNSSEQMYVSQVRVFKKKEQASFELDAPPRLVFGITPPPPEGIILPVYLSPDGFTQEGFPSYEEPWAYLRPCTTRWSVNRFFKYRSKDQEREEGLKFVPQNLAAYLIGQSFNSQSNTSLEHDHFRLAQKAGLTIFENIKLLRGDFTKIFYGDIHDKGAHQELEKSLEGERNLSGRKSYSDLIQELFEGRTLYNVKIISDGRTATVEPVPFD